MMRRRLIALFSFVFVCLAAWMSPPANATSAYDDYFTATSQLVLHSDACSDDLDISSTWSHYIRTSSTYGSSFTAAESSGTMGVSSLPRYNVDGNGHPTLTAVIAFWSESSTLSVTWPTWGYMQVQSTDRAVIMYLTGTGGNCSVYIGTYGTGTSAYVSSNDGAVESFFFDGSPNYPTGYAGESVIGDVPHAKYVALGDSYSSGEGVSPFDSFTASSSNSCHRSFDAYPVLLAANGSLDLDDSGFVACSGATTGKVSNGGSGVGAWGEQKQVDALSAETEVVTITVGGNDIGFSEFASACILSSCSLTTDIYDDTLGNIANVLPLALEDLYDTILQEAPNAEVYVLEYPLVVPEVEPESYTSCALLDSDDPMEDMLAGHHVIELLNDGIATAVDEANTRNTTSRMHLVSTTFEGSPFEGHDVCSNDPWFNNISLTEPVEYTFHPDEDGQAALAEIMEDELTS